MSDFVTMNISAHGLRAQGERVRVIAENIANADTAPLSPDQEPYTRQVITFENRMNRAAGVKMVEVKDVEKVDKNPFVEKYMPDHPGANEAGYVRMPNINTLIEMTDMREAQRSYEANLGMIEQTRDMMGRTIDLLR